MDSVRIPYDTWRSVPPQTWVGHSFSGWTSVGHNISTAMYSIENGVSVPMDKANYAIAATSAVSFRNLISTGNGYVTLTALWNVNKYVIRYALDNGESR